MHWIYQFLAAYPYVSLALTGLMIWMLVDAYRRSSDTVWFWIILFFQPLGPIIYFFAVKLRDVRALPAVSLWQRGPSLRELRYRAENIPTMANHFALARRLIEGKEYAEAVPHLEAALKPEPDHGQVLYSLALCHVRLGQADQAVPLLERLLQRDPRWSHYAGWQLLIEARDQLGDEAGALHACREVARLSATLENQCLLAEHLLDAGQGEEAGKVLTRALDDYSFAPRSIRWRNRRWARTARRLLRQGAAR